MQELWYFKNIYNFNIYIRRKEKLKRILFFEDRLQRNKKKKCKKNDSEN